MRKYLLPFIINGGLVLLLVGLLLLIKYDGVYYGGGLPNMALVSMFLLATLLLPLTNIVLLLQSSRSTRPHLTPVYGLLSVLSLILIWFIWSYGLQAFHKIEG